MFKLLVFAVNKWLTNSDLFSTAFHVGFCSETVIICPLSQDNHGFSSLPLRRAGENCFHKLHSQLASVPQLVSRGPVRLHAQGYKCSLWERPSEGLCVQPGPERGGTGACASLSTGKPCALWRPATLPFHYDWRWRRMREILILYSRSWALEAFLRLVLDLPTALSPVLHGKGNDYASWQCSFYIQCSQKALGHLLKSVKCFITKVLWQAVFNISAQTVSFYCHFFFYCFL